MKIECKLHREGGTKVQLNGTEYHFEPKADGSHVADVSDEEHIAQFLAIPEGYKIHGAEIAKAKPAKQAPKPAETLLGSDVHESSYEINGKTYSLGDVVAAAHTASGLSVKDWNELEADTRHDLIDEQLDKLQADEKTPEQELADLREQYKAKFGSAPHHAMKADTIRTKLAE